MEKRISIFFILLGILGILDTFFILIRSNINLGNTFPGIAGIGCIVFGFFYPQIYIFTQSGIGKCMKNLVIWGFFVFLVTFLLSIIVIQKNASKIPDSNADAVIVLGAGLKDGYEVSKTLAMRLDKAIEYLNENKKTLVLVSGGQGASEKRSEADAMKEYLINHGISASTILTENESTNTVENFKYSKTILDTIFPNEYKIIFVTNDFHVYRSGMIAKDTGLDAQGLACSSYAPMLPNFYIREYFSLVKYYLFDRPSHIV